MTIEGCDAIDHKKLIYCKDEGIGAVEHLKFLFHPSQFTVIGFQDWDDLIEIAKADPSIIVLPSRMAFDISNLTIIRTFRRLGLHKTMICRMTADFVASSRPGWEGLEVLVGNEDHQEMSADVRRLAILYVDDDPLVVKAFERSMRASPYEVLSAYSGEEALILIREKKVDVAVIDLAMSRMDGLSLFKALRKHDPFLPIIVSTGYGTSKIISQFLELGCNGFLEKPYDPEWLKGMLDSLAQASPDEKAFM